MFKKINLKDASDCSKIIAELTSRWTELHNTPSTFSYKLNIKRQKILNGKYNFLCLLNTDRSNLRRKPQKIESLNPTFNENKFNFTTIKPSETLLVVQLENNEISMVINISPLTVYHSLILPNILDRLPQKLTIGSIFFCLKFLNLVADNNFRIGYNSPGALASVNHLHLHLLYIPSELFIDKITLQQIKNNIFRVSPPSPFQAICFIISTKKCIKKYASKIHLLIENLCNENIPHNLFFTKKNVSNIIKVFLFVRANSCIVKDLFELNMAFCEFSGFITLGDEMIFESISEDIIVEKMSSEIGNIFEKIEKMIENFDNI